MAKVSYASLKLKTNTDVTIVDFNGTKIEVLKYLPIEDKYDLISITLQKSREDTLYNPLKVDMFFHLHLIYMYTNLSFTEKQREDEAKLYDTLSSNGLIDLVLESIDEYEYEILNTYLEETIDQDLEYKTTVAYLLNSFLGDMPAKIENIQHMMDEIDQEKFTNAINFAKALNGGRDI